ncbi:hypothetical protein ACOMHN_002468 [Nucella lapillus]
MYKTLHDFGWDFPEAATAPPGGHSTTRRPQHHQAATAPPSGHSTTRRPQHHQAATTPPGGHSTTRRPQHHQLHILAPQTLTQHTGPAEGMPDEPPHDAQSSHPC